MHSRQTESTTLQLAAWLAAKGGSVHSNDVGPLLGHAAWLSQSAWFDEPRPLGWEEAIAAALAAPTGKVGTWAAREVRSGVQRVEQRGPCVPPTRDPSVPRHKSH